MRVLLDTHTFLWFVEDDPKLNPHVQRIIEDADTQPFLSMATIWEMAIKVNLGKLGLPAPFALFIPDQLRLNTIMQLDIAIEHTVRVASLPLHHRDPFDRLLIAQPLVEQMPIISRDAAFDAYGVTRVW